MKYFLGIDNGGTSTKAAILDVLGREIGSFGMDTKVSTPFAGYVERDLEEMWHANCEVVKGVLAKTGISPKDIAAVGISGHGKGLYLWGKDGKPLYRGIPSTDQRAADIVAAWKQSGVESNAYEISCQHVMVSQPVALLSWLKQNEPAIYDEIRWVFACKDYIRFRLTDVAAAEVSDYSGANLLNLSTGQFDPRLLSLFGIEEIAPALPPLCRADEIAGRITMEAAKMMGLIEGTPVIGGMFDINACAIGSGVIDEKMICMIAGTWSINEYLRKEPVRSKTVLMNSLFALDGYYLIEESSPTSAGNLEWFIRQFLPECKDLLREKGGNIHEEIDAWVEEIDVNESIPVFLPFIMGSNVHPLAKGSLIGLTQNHTRKHVVRAFFEGITFCHKYHLDKLLATREKGDSRPVIRLSGGAAKADVWGQMFADVCGLSVEILEAGEVGALGCAIACAKAVGEYPDMEHAVKQMVRVKKRFEPDAGRMPVYKKKYELYRCIAEGMDFIWERMK